MCPLKTSQNGPHVPRDLKIGRRRCGCPRTRTHWASGSWAPPAARHQAIFAHLPGFRRYQCWGPPGGRFGSLLGRPPGRRLSSHYSARSMGVQARFQLIILTPSSTRQCTPPTPRLHGTYTETLASTQRKDTIIDSVLDAARGNARNLAG